MNDLNPSSEAFRSQPGVFDPTSFSGQDQFGQRLDALPRTLPRTVTVAADNVNPLDDELRCDTTSNSVTMTLETPVGCGGREHLFKKPVAANTMTVTSSALIDGVTSVGVTAQHSVIKVKSTGSTWDLLYAGPGTATSGITLLAEQATTSGTTKDFTIPAGAKRVSVMFKGVSFTAAVTAGIQLGDAGGIEATGYVAGTYDGTTQTASTTFFPVFLGAAAANVIDGCVTISLENASSFSWCLSGNLFGASVVHSSAGTKSLDAELTTVRVMGGTFDAGAVSVSWE